MARIILAEIWRKNMDAMKESERTRTMKGSLVALMVSAVERNGGKGEGEKVTRTLSDPANRPCTISA
jgi:hypothetical protein